MRKVSGFLIDANSFSDGNLSPEVREALRTAKADPVISPRGQLAKELRRSNAELFIEYEDAGRFALVCDSATRSKQRELTQAGAHSSDDPHVLAVAIVSRANLLVSNDRALGTDFKGLKRIESATIRGEPDKLPKARNIITYPSGKGAARKGTASANARRLLASARAYRNGCVCRSDEPCC